jgi:hypothetical protein
VWAFEFLQGGCAQEELLKRMTTILAYELINGHFYFTLLVKSMFIPAGSSIHIDAIWVKKLHSGG